MDLPRPNDIDHQNEIVIDTAIILDILVTSRPRHKFGKLIGMYLIDKGICICVPLSSLFEIKSGLLAAKQEAQIKGGTFIINEDISEATPLQYHFIPIDQDFFEKYFLPELPHLKASDYMNVALAKKNNLRFITEDADQYAAAVQTGVKVFTSEEFRNICLDALQ